MTIELTMNWNGMKDNVGNKKQKGKVHKAPRWLTWQPGLDSGSGHVLSVSPLFLTLLKV